MKLFTKEQIQEFSELDYSIFNFVINNAQKLPYMTIRELAQEAHVSTASITRFCQKVECDGYSEFKVKFKMKTEERNKMTFSNDVTSIETFISRMKDENFESETLEVAHCLESAKTLIFTGVGNSGVLANYAARFFSSIGKFALSVDNPMFEITIENPEDTVIMVFSVEGEESNLIENLTKLKAKGVQIVSITNSRRSTLAKLSSYNLAHYVQREINRNFDFPSKIDVTTQVPVMILIETLAKEVHDIRLKKQL